MYLTIMQLGLTWILYIKFRVVPRSKHNSFGLQKPVS